MLAFCESTAHEYEALKYASDMIHHTVKVLVEIHVYFTGCDEIC